jgi:hypothetical protein
LDKVVEDLKNIDLNTITERQAKPIIDSIFAKVENGTIKEMDFLLLSIDHPELIKFYDLNKI